MREAPHGIDPGVFRLLLDACKRQNAAERALDLAKMDQYRAEARDLMRKYGVVFDQDELRERGERFDGGAL
jgi:hypothetical protein